MKHTIVLLFGICFYLDVFSQEFSFDLYFEDAEGYKDTLTFGYDPAATDSIDVAFGEVNIIDQPFDSVFEVRISEVSFLRSNENFPMLEGVNPKIHSKMSIYNKSCSPDYYENHSAIHLSKASFPLTISWDSSYFDEECLERSLITDWWPGAWFDALYDEIQAKYQFKKSNSGSFPTTAHYYLGDDNDTIRTLFISLTSKEFVTNLSGSHSFIELFPNPVDSYLTIHSSSGIEDLKLMDLSGKEYFPQLTDDQVDMRGLNEGVYILELKTRDGRVLRKKVVKE